MGGEARTVTHHNAAEIAEWCGGILVEQENALDSSLTSPGINVPCGDTVKRALVNSIVIQRHDGTFDVVR